MSKREQLEEYFSQSLEIETLLRLCPDDEDTIIMLLERWQRKQQRENER